MIDSDVPDQRRVARFAAVLLSLVAGSLVGVPGPAEAGRVAAPLLRLGHVSGSTTRSLALPLAAAGLHHVGDEVWRTQRLGTTTYRMVGVTWQGRDPHLRVRTRDAHGWTRWMRAPVISDLPNGASAEERRSSTRGTDLLWVGPSDGVQVSVRGPRPRDLELVLIDPGVLPGDATATRPSTARAATTVPTGAPRPLLGSRKAWGADETWRTSDPRYNKTIKQVHVHHTATGNDYRRRDVPGLIRGMYRYHTANLGWSDIGYNFLVDRFGRTWVGRAGGPGRRVRGAHTLGFNNTSTGVAVIGNFEGQPPNDEIVTAIVHLAAWKLDRNDREPDGTIVVRSRGSDLYPDGERVRLPVIDGHRDTNQTACPGVDLYDLLPRIRHRTQRRVDRF